ncbi:MAG: hypothetical protein AAF899_05940 [Pseudomonadota bacterium]
MLGALVGMVVMLFAITVVKMGEDRAIVGNPSAAQAGGWSASDFIAPLQGDEARVHTSATPDRAVE